MKKFVTVILFLLCHVSRSQDTISYSTMTTKQFAEWDEIESNWKTEHFMPFLLKENIKLSCEKCSSVYAWVILKRDEHNTTFSVLEHRKCGVPFKGKHLSELKRILGLIVLPEDYKGKVMKVYLGNALKC